MSSDNNLPIRTKKMPSRRQFDRDVEIKIKDVFKFYDEEDRDFGTRGFFEQEYKTAFNKFINNGVGFVDVACSGTAALLAILAALNLNDNCEVLVSPITDPGAISPLSFLGLKARVVDFEKGQYFPSLQTIEARYNPKVKALVVNHMSGKPIPDIEKISKWCKDQKIILIEDCSQAHGALVSGRKVGTFGDVAFFSTMYSKNHSTGGNGGIIYTEDKDLFEQIGLQIHKGKPFYKKDFNEKDPREFILPALNLELSELNCAIGTVTLSKLESVNKRRNDFLIELNAQFKKKEILCEIQLPSKNDAPYFAMIKCHEKIKSKKKEFALSLIKEGLSINGDYNYIVTDWPWCKKLLSDDFIPKNAIDFKEETINLLFNENYGKDELGDIINAFTKVESIYLKSKV